MSSSNGANGDVDSDGVYRSARCYQYYRRLTAKRGHQYRVCEPASGAGYRRYEQTSGGGNGKLCGGDGRRRRRNAIELLGDDRCDWHGECNGDSQRNCGSYNVNASVSGLLPVGFALTNVSPNGGVITVTNATIGQNMQEQITITLSPPVPPGGVTFGLSNQAMAPRRWLEAAVEPDTRQSHLFSWRALRHSLRSSKRSRTRARQPSRSAHLDTRRQHDHHFRQFRSVSPGRTASVNRSASSRDQVRRSPSPRPGLISSEIMPRPAGARWSVGKCACEQYDHKRG